MIARLFVAILVFAAAARAAQITDVATAGDDKRPLEVDLDATYVHTRTQTKITRETTVTGVGIQLEDELTHVQTLDAIDLRLAVGLWHDLELHVMANVALRDVQDWSYAPGVTAATSSLSNNRINISGCANASLCSAVQPIVAVPGESQHAGLFDPTIGIAWKPINEWREMKLQNDLFPAGRPVATWVIGFDYTLPLGGGLDDPSRWGANSAPSGTQPAAGGESRKAHVLSLWTAFSKRYRVLEPYVRFEGDAPFAAMNAYDNCSHQELLADVAAANCAAQWKGQTGYQPPFEAAATLGFELVVAEDREAERRLAFDLRGDMRWHGPQRGYTQMTDALGKLTYSDEYVTSTGQLGIYGRIARWLHARVYGTLGVDSAHFLTDEDVGEAKVSGPIVVSGGSGAPAPDQNPNYDFRVDQVGRRLRAEPAVFWGVAGTLSVDF